MRTALRFVSGAELAGAFAAADLVVLPYREIDQSGVLFTALAFGKPLLLSAVGGFPEIRRAPSSSRRATRDALAAALSALLADPAQLARMAAASAPPRTARYGWDAIAQRTLALYAAAPGVDRVVARGPAPSWRGAMPLLAGVEEPGPLGHPLRERVVLVDDQLDQRRARARRRPSRAAASTAREATPLPRAAVATQ